MLKLIFALMVFGFSAQACEQPVATVASLESTAVASSCFDDISCPPPAKCIGGKCVVGGQCLGDVDCPIGKRCVQGVCK